MKKLTLVLLGCCIVITSIFSQGTTSSVHSITITDIDGSSFSLGSYAGKKILILIIPTNTNDMSRINDIDSFQHTYGDSIKIIGIPSYENGYIDSNKAKIKSIYTSRGIPILLTEGMHTKDFQGSGMEALVSWLTHKSQNQRYNVDIKGVGQKFFIDKQGILYAVLSPVIPLISNISKTYAQGN